MTQTIVPFITGPSTQSMGQVTPAPQQSNVFNFEIDNNAQAYYTDAMNQIQNNMNALTTLLSSDPTLSQGSDQTTARGYSQAIYTALANLNDWAAMQFVNSSGVQQQRITRVQTGVDANNNPLYTNGFLVSSADSFGDITALTGSINAPASTSAFSQTLSSIPPTSTLLTTTMSSQMAQSLESTNALLRAAGFNIDQYISLDSNTGAGGVATPAAALVTALQSAISQSPSAFTSIFGPANTPASGATPANISSVNSALNAALASARSAQVIGAGFNTNNVLQILNTTYVLTASTLFYNQMNQLNSALNTNQTILSFLNGVQDLMNQKTPQAFIAQLQQLSNFSGSSPTSQQFTQYEQNSFNTNLGTNATVTDSNIAGILNGSTPAPAGSNTQFLPAAFTSYNPNQQVSVTDGQSAIQVLINNCQYLASQATTTAGGAQAPIVQALGAIQNDLTAVQAQYDTSSGTTAIQQWIQDFQQNSTTNGNFQTNLSNAITACQSFNNTQQQQLNATMFEFQQFYQSASTMLNTSFQTIQQIAANIKQ